MDPVVHVLLVFSRFCSVSEDVLDAGKSPPFDVNVQEGGLASDSIMLTPLNDFHQAPHNLRITG